MVIQVQKSGDVLVLWGEAATRAQHSDIAGNVALNDTSKIAAINEGGPSVLMLVCAVLLEPEL